jgi:RHS repeat-associated protein
VELPLDQDSERKLVEPTYNRSGAMESISLDGEVYVSRIAYNAMGQRVLMAYGNEIMTRFAYDAVNFRLLRQRSEKFTNPSGFPLTYEAVSGSVKQDCQYDFDLAGNIVNMMDDSPNAGVGGSSTGLSRDFGYDALYRLLTATGRESGDFANSSTPWDDGFYVPDDSHTNTRDYTRTYTYDQLGNMLKVNHNGGTGNTFNRWFNDYDVSTTSYHTSNLVNKVKYGSTTIANSFDDNGNMVSEGVSRHFEWDYADQMRVYRTQTSGAEPTVFAQYLYDAGGVRVKKIVRKSTGNHEVTVYIDGVFEYLYEVTSSNTRSEEKNEIHVMDGRSRIARREIFGASWTGSQTDAVKYQLEDHLGNASFTLTATGGAYRREEYFPFGETSFGSYTKKRYRFCGKERDEESGLYYYGARYYMPCQCRFVSVDPLAGEMPFFSPFSYASNNPVVLVDIDGLAPSGGDKNGGPDRFAIDTEKAGSSEMLYDGTWVTYVSGKTDDIETYQEIFENTNTLDFGNGKQIDSYFQSVYGIIPHKWSPRGEFGSDANRKRVVSAFEAAGTQTGLAPSFLFTIAMGEGLGYFYSVGVNNRFDVSISSYVAFGLDMFGSAVHNYKNNGTLPADFNSGGTKKVREGDELDLSSSFPPGSEYFDLRNPNGSPRIRNESGGKMDIFPVTFKNIETGALGASAVYATAYRSASEKAIALGWENLNENQSVYYSYFDVQAPNGELDRYGNDSANFLNGSVKFDLRNAGSGKDSNYVHTKAYDRWVSWRYVRLSGYFTR